MKFAFISGIPASGKTYIAKKVSLSISCLYVNLDDLRRKMVSDPKLESWVNFFKNKNEHEYWSSITQDEHWSNVLKQAEAFGLSYLRKINEIKNTAKSAIFESVSILPHLAYRDLDFPGIYLLGESIEMIFKRLKENPRWGGNEELQRMEAEWFYLHEGAMYESEAKKYGFKSFRHPEKAEEELLKLMQD